MNNEIKLGLIGAGKWGQNYINTIRQVIKTNNFNIFDQKTITY